MPTRVTRQMETAGPSPAEPSVKPVRVTEAMLDEAAERALQGVDDHQAVATKRLWAMDNNLDAANAFHRSEMEARERSHFARVSNISYTCPYVLTQDEVKRVVELYPEFDVIFKNQSVHDHAMGAVTKGLEQRLLESQVPPGCRYKDIGGDVLSHVERGDLNCIVVHGDHDMKDPVRRVHVKLRLRMIAERKVTVPGGENSVEMAQDILAGGTRFYVDMDARLDETHTFFAIMNQVYDIPIEGLATIMDSGRTRVLVGSVHFTNDFFELNGGELPDIKARYEVDRKKDRFRMGFIGSGAPWYDHSFSDFARYGTDQILEGRDTVYSYKVVERRGDTIRFRVLRIGDGARPNKKQYYALPGVDVVDVDGFELDESTVATTGPLKRKPWRFPAGIWQVLLRDASVRAARGGLDFNNLVDTYRVSVVPHQLNGVPIASGTRVDMDLLVPMVVHAGFCAYADMVLFDMEVGYNMKANNVLRQLGSETTLYKAFRVFVDAVIKVGGACVNFFTDLAGLLSSSSHDRLRDALVMWRPVARLRRVHAANVLSLRKTDKLFLGTTESLNVEHMAKHRLVDIMNDLRKRPDAAQAVLAACGEYMTQEQRAMLPVPEAQEGQSEVVSSGVSAAQTQKSSPPSYVTEDPRTTTVVRVTPSPDREQHRTNAINEAIQENQLEAQKIERTCLSHLREVARGGGVDVGALKKGKSRMSNPDMWKVVNGVLTESALGFVPSEFSYAAVCCLKPSVTTGSHIWSVDEREFKGTDSVTEQPVERKHFVVQDSTYTGWVFVNDSMKIYNGPDCLDAMRKTLDMVAEYDIEVHQGGPGAGKTTQIVDSYCLGDVVVCPVKESTEDTRGKLAERFPDQGKKYWKKHVRTVDSVLVNFLTSERDLGFTASCAHADEAFMASSGKWHAVFRLFGVSKVRAYGDTEQIPHVPRVDAPKMYVKLKPDVWVYHWLVYRCKPEIMALWSGYYGNKLRTPLKRGGKVLRLYDPAGLELVRGTALLCMYQADKVEIRRLFPRYRGPVMTVHESEGKTFDAVVLFNFEVRKRPKEDVTYLFNRKEYVIVGTSRARNSFVYVKKDKQPDLVTEAIDRASDPRRIMAVMDVASAGVAKEF